MSKTVIDVKPSTLAEKGISQMKQDGFVIFEGLFGPDFIEPLYEEYLKRINAPVSYGGQIGRSLDKVNAAYVDQPLALHPKCVEYATHKPFIRILENYLESRIELSYFNAYRTHAIQGKALRNELKTPGVFMGWHSDANLIAPNRGYRCVVSMLYLHDVNPGQGALELIRGSHTYGGKKRAWMPEEIEARKKDIVEVCAPAGSVILFDMETIHRAGISLQKPRDIIRGMYVPEGGYTEPLIMSNEVLPATMDAETARILRFGKSSSIPVPLSEGPPKHRSSVRKFASRMRTKMRYSLGLTPRY